MLSHLRALQACFFGELTFLDLRFGILFSQLRLQRLSGKIWFDDCHQPAEAVVGEEAIGED